jgi:hypothetical protein
MWLGFAHAPCITTDRLPHPPRVYRLGACQVTVLEMRTGFSRVNILTLWPQTADDLMGFGAKLFYPR